MMDDYHDLPNTPTRVNRWVKVELRPSGALLCTEYASSRETGADLPSDPILILPDGAVCE